MDTLVARLRESGLREADVLADRLVDGSFSMDGSPRSVEVSYVQRDFGIKIISVTKGSGQYLQRLGEAMLELLANLEDEPEDSQVAVLGIRGPERYWDHYSVFESGDGRILGCLKLQPTNVATPKEHWDMFRGQQA